MRQKFVVVKVQSLSGNLVNHVGAVLSDGTKFEGRLVEFYLPMADGLVVGDVVSADILLGTENELDPESVFVESRVTKFVESGPNAGEERTEFDTAGGPEKEARGWQPRGTPGTGLNGGRPDPGRFSHPMQHEENKDAKSR